MKKRIDPFSIIPEEICDEIMSYFGTKDIMEASLVNKNWYNLIGRSKICMKKLYLKPSKSHQNHEFFISIMDSSRMYQNLELVDRFNEVKSNTKFFRLMREIVTKLSQTLVTLKISNDLIIKTDLPKLKELVFDAYNYKSLIVANGLLTKTRALEKLSVVCWQIDEKSKNYLRLFLMENESLKVLKIEDSRVFHNLNSTNIKFRLSELDTSNRDPIPFEFYKVHSDSLKVGKTSIAQSNLNFFMSTFSQLEILFIKGYWYHDANADIPSNSTIKKIIFEISDFAIRDGYVGEYITRIIKKVQNLQELEIDFINSQIFRALINCPTLKLVKYRKFALTRQDIDELQMHEKIHFMMH